MTVVVLLVVYGLVVRLVFPATPSQPMPTPILKVIYAATPTSFLNPGGTPIPSATPTLDPGKYGGIGINQYVQITGTGGDGLRLRAGPGTDQSPLFLGLDAEVFQVRDGPKEVGGLIWWFLVSPSDENRKGWAAASYLVLVPSN